MKGLINLKNKDHKCFMWCHVRLINPTNSHPERINKQDKKTAANLNYSDIVFPLDINDYKKIEARFQMQVNVFGYENKVYPLYISKKSYDQALNLLLITEKGKSHYVIIKDFNRLMFSRTKHKDKKHRACLAWLKNYFLKKYRHKQKRMSKITYSKSEPDFSNFVITSLLTFPPIFSESKSESGFSSK